MTLYVVLASVLVLVACHCSLLVCVTLGSRVSVSFLSILLSTEIDISNGNLL